MHGSVALTPPPMKHRNHQLFTRCTLPLAGLRNTVISLFSLFLPSHLFYLGLLGSLFFLLMLLFLFFVIWFFHFHKLLVHAFFFLPHEVRYSPAPFSLGTVPWVFSALSLRINCSTCCGVVQLHTCSLFSWAPCLLSGYVQTAPLFCSFCHLAHLFKGVWEVLCFLCLEVFCGGQRTA